MFGVQLSQCCFEARLGAAAGKTPFRDDAAFPGYARVEEAGARVEEAGARGEEAGARIEKAGAWLEEASARAEEAGAWTEEAGARGEEAGTRAFLGKRWDVEKNPNDD